MLIRRALGSANGQASEEGELHRSDDRFQSAFRFFLTFYHEHKLDNTSTYPGVLEALRCLRASQPDVLMAVLTNKPVRPSRAICDALDLSSFFFTNYGGDSFATKKPDPHGLLQVIQEACALRPGHDWTTPPSQAGVVMVGDSAVDVLTAKHAGVASLGCRYGLSPRSLEEAGPDMLCDSPAEWPVLLGPQAVVSSK